MSRPEFSRVAITRDVRERWPSIIDAAVAKGLRPGLVGAAFRALPGVRPLQLAGTSTKTEKGLTGAPIPVETGVIYLAPATEATSLRETLCKASTPACRAACLGHSAGRMRNPSVKASRLWKTALLLGDPETFWDLVMLDLATVADRARRNGHVPAFRFNGSSDVRVPLPVLDWAKNRDVRTYDYTKHAERAHANARSFEHGARNYRLTYSMADHRNPEHHARAARVLETGANVAIVFDVERSEQLPTWYDVNARPRRVLDGDLHDARFLDPLGGYVIGLRIKGTRAAKRAARRGGFAFPVK